MVENIIERWLEWHLYKILFTGILIPLLITNVRDFLFQDPYVAFGFLLTAFILLLPIIAKIISLIERN